VVLTILCYPQYPTGTPTYEPTASPTAAPTDEPTAVSVFVSHTDDTGGSSRGPVQCCFPQSPTGYPTSSPTPGPTVVTGSPSATPTAYPTAEYIDEVRPLVVSATQLRGESDPSSVVEQEQFPTAAPTSSPTATPTFEPTAVRHGYELLKRDQRHHQSGDALPLADSDGGAHRVADRRAHGIPHGGAHGGAHERE
jgi:hypothetical protein